MPQASCPPAERIVPLEMSPASTAIGATVSSARFPVEYDGAATTLAEPNTSEAEGGASKGVCDVRIANRAARKGETRGKVKKRRGDNPAKRRASSAAER